MKWWEAGILALVGLWLLKRDPRAPEGLDTVPTSAPGGFATPGAIEEPDVAPPGPVVLSRTGPADLAGPGGEPFATPNTAYWAAMNQALDDGDCAELCELVALGPPA